MPKLTAFKAYDVRGRMPDEINEPLARDIGRAFAAFVKPKRVAVGYDIRLSSPALAAALKAGLRESGCDVLDNCPCDLSRWRGPCAGWSVKQARRDE